MPKFFDMSSLSEGTSIYYISPEETKLFHPKEVQNVVSSINIWMNLCFFVAKNVVTIEEIIEMKNVKDTLTEAARYDSRIWYH